MTQEDRYTRLAIKFDKQGDINIWMSALFCSKVVSKNGHGERGKTLALADQMSRSADTVEDRAHGYWMYEALCGMDGGIFRTFVRQVRKMPYVHFSHFRELWDLKQSHKLSDADCLSLLNDIYQAEGGISSRKLGEIAKEKFGDGRDWTYYAQLAQKRIGETLQQPDTPPDVREVLINAYEKIGEKA